MKNDGRLKMGEVVERLRWEYPQDRISAGTIRFWEKKKLLKPTEKTKGGQRLYSEEDINQIRYLKELSIAGTSIAVMKHEVARMKERLEKVKSDPKARKETMERFIKTIQTQRQRNALDAELDFFDRHLDGGQKTSKIYDEEALAQLIGTSTEIETARTMIERAERYGLLMPELVSGARRYSRQDEMILKVLLYLESLKEGALERCKDLASTVRYLTTKVEIYKGFGVDRRLHGPTEYTAELYNLVLWNQYYAEGKKRRRP